MVGLGWLYQEYYASSFRGLFDLDDIITGDVRRLSTLYTKLPVRQNEHSEMNGENCNQ